MNALIANASLPLNFTTPIGRSVQAGHRSPSYNQNDLMVSPNCAFACSYNLPMISSITSLFLSNNLSCLVGLDFMCEPLLNQNRKNGFILPCRKQASGFFAHSLSWSGGFSPSAIIFFYYY